MGTSYSITEMFGGNLARLLADKIAVVYEDFDRTSFILAIQRECVDRTYTGRIDLIATTLKGALPTDYPSALKILLAILGDENPHQTGMFTHYYWIMPLGRFVEKYGLDYFDLSMHAIAEITKRNTGEVTVQLIYESTHRS